MVFIYSHEAHTFTTMHVHHFNSFILDATITSQLASLLALLFLTLPPQDTQTLLISTI